MRYMKTVKRLLVLLLCAVLVLLTACGDKKDPNGTASENLENTPHEEKTLQLLYCSNDTLNPFNTKNRSNFELSTLLFEPLVTVGDDFTPIMRLAESITAEVPS